MGSSVWRNLMCKLSSICTSSITGNYMSALHYPSVLSSTFLPALEQQKYINKHACSQYSVFVVTLVFSLWWHMFHCRLIGCRFNSCQGLFDLMQPKPDLAIHIVSCPLCTVWDFCVGFLFGASRPLTWSPMDLPTFFFFVCVFFFFFSFRRRKWHFLRPNTWKETMDWPDILGKPSYR